MSRARTHETSSRTEKSFRNSPWRRWRLIQHSVALEKGSDHLRVELDVDGLILLLDHINRAFVAWQRRKAHQADRHMGPFGRFPASQTRARSRMKTRPCRGSVLGGLPRSRFLRNHRPRAAHRHAEAHRYRIRRKGLDAQASDPQLRQ